MRLERRRVLFCAVGDGFMELIYVDTSSRIDDGVGRVDELVCVRVCV